jgi:hypothetical protein
MKYKILHIMSLTVLLSACNTGKHVIGVHMSSEFPVVASAEMVRVYTEGEVAPDSSKVIGEMWTDYEPRAKKITPDSALNIIKEVVSVHGGNGFYVMEHRKPNYLETNNHYFGGMVLLTKDTTIYNRTNNPFSMSYAEYNMELKRKQVSPHYLHLDAGLSLQANEQPVIGETEPVIDGTLKYGLGWNASYTYLVPYSLYGFGVVYSGHLASATVAERYASTTPSYSVCNTNHSVVPIISMYGCSEKHLYIVSIGLGYMWNILDWDYTEAQNKRSVEAGLTLYASVEYEYRITQNFGVSGRLYLNQLSDSNGDDNPDIINGGLSLGINYHF